MSIFPSIFIKETLRQQHSRTTFKLVTEGLQNQFNKLQLFVLIGSGTLLPCQREHLNRRLTDNAVILLIIHSLQGITVLHITPQSVKPCIAESYSCSFSLEFHARKGFRDLKLSFLLCQSLIIVIAVSQILVYFYQEA